MRPEDHYRLRRRRFPNLHALLVLWGLVVATGFGALAAYSRTPGIDVIGMRKWPEESAITPSDCATLAMFLHPQCPCSQASLEQFNRILARASNRLNAWIVFVRPKDVPEGWEQSDLWFAAKQIPGVRISVDAGGIEARRFGVATSGATVLYGASGSLLFQGGITGERGHAGDNVGSEAVLASLRSGHSAPQLTPVFGCSLFE